MPTIRKLKRKVKLTENSRIRHEIYNTTLWRNLRCGYLLANPLCELCLLNGKITAGVDVHHIISPFKLKDVNRYAFDSRNLITLCKKCHGYIHSNHLEETLYHIYYERQSI